jgi:hypothetical protein
VLHLKSSHEADESRCLLAPKFAPKSRANRSQIESKSIQNRAKIALGGLRGASGAIGGDPEGSRDALGPFEGLPGHLRTLPRRSWGVSGSPKAVPRCTREASGRLFRVSFSQSISQEAPGAIFDRILGRSREARHEFRMHFYDTKRMSALFRAACRFEPKTMENGSVGPPKWRQNERKSRLGRPADTAFWHVRQGRRSRQAAGAFSRAGTVDFGGPRRRQELFNL